MSMYISVPLAYAVTLLSSATGALHGNIPCRNPMRGYSAHRRRCSPCARRSAAEAYGGVAEGGGRGAQEQAGLRQQQLVDERHLFLQRARHKKTKGREALRKEPP